MAFTKAGVLGIQAGDVYSFPDGAPNKPEEAMSDAEFAEVALEAAE